MPSQIIVTNSAEKAVIDIEGIIGIPEDYQFDNPNERIATYDRFRDAVKRISQIDAAEVVVNIRSLGGLLNDALLIYDALRSLPATITTRCYGLAASAATVIAQAASAGRRELSETCLYLIHKASTCACGNSVGLTAEVEMLDKTDERLSEIYALASGRPAAEYAELMNANSSNGKWLSPAEAVAVGLADRTFRYAHLPCLRTV